jgi:hypothetical protein
MRLAESPECDTDRDIAQIVFWGDSLTERSDDDVRAVLARSEVEAFYAAWFAFDVFIEPGRTLVDIVLDQERNHMSAGEREYLERMRGTHVRPYEVTEVKSEQGLHLVDLWTDAPIWVRERAATRQVARWDVVAARLMVGADGDLVIDGGLYPYPPQARDDMLKELRRAHRRFVRSSPGDDLTVFFKRIGAVVCHQFWLERVMFPPRLTIVTPEGDLVVVSSATFDIRDRAALERALAGHPDVEREADGSFVWLEDASFGRRSLGTFAIKGKRVVFEAMSRERAERGRGFLEGIAGDAVGFRVMRYEDLEQARKRLPARGQSPKSEISPEVEAQILGSFYEQHCKGWLDQPIPALGNRSPRHAERLKTIRPRLIALVRVPRPAPLGGDAAVAGRPGRRADDSAAGEGFVKRV